jgi:endo-1,4-beta-xylanase
MIVDWALSKGMKVKGHVLVWHVTTPDFVRDMTSDQVREQVKRHIFTTMAHFRDRIKIWDVVNESLAPDGTLANNIFLQKLGPGYIEQCFRWAHEADPSAFLIYNDNKVEGMNVSFLSSIFYHKQYIATYTVLTNLTQIIRDLTKIKLMDFITY